MFSGSPSPLDRPQTEEFLRLRKQVVKSMFRADVRQTPTQTVALGVVEVVCIIGFDGGGDVRLRD